MKAISLTQPMAYAIFHGKDVENRKWTTKYRGPLLIHASQGFDKGHYRWIVDNDNRLCTFIPEESSPVFVHGALIGVVNLVQVVRVHGSRWFFGPYGFCLRDAREFKEPIPYRGALNLFYVPDEVVKEAMASC